MKARNGLVGQVCAGATADEATHAAMVASAIRLLRVIISPAMLLRIGGSCNSLHHPARLGQFNCDPAGISLRAVDVVSTGLPAVSAMRLAAKAWQAPVAAPGMTLHMIRDSKSPNWTSRCGQCEDVSSRRNIGFAKTD
jgi:hypothetical protein